MNYVCKRGYKCMCFQCGEKDCEHFESEPPKWIKDFFENEEIFESYLNQRKVRAKPKAGGLSPSMTHEYDMDALRKAAKV